MALTHEPIGKPGGPGLWGMKGAQLPAFIQHVRNDLMESRGMPEAQATQMAIGICRDWAMGRRGANAETKAKAMAAMAEFDRLRAQAKATRSTPVSGYDEDGLDPSWDGDLDGLPDLTGLTVADFDAADGGPPAGDMSRAAKLGTGARFKALKSKLGAKGASDPGALAAWIGRKKYGKAKFAGLAAKARKGGVSRSAPGELLRFYPLEDIHIVTRAEGDGSGTVVEAYATVFDQAAEIHDYQGHYLEVIDRGAFDERLAQIRRSHGGLAGEVKVLYNHGKTMEGQPAPEFQVPLGTPVDIRPETRGLLTRTRYDTGDPFAERILAKVKSGSITAQSFVGGIVRSTPELRGPGDRYRRRGGALETVRRMALGLREYGPVLFPAYSGAEILGVRMQLPGAAGGGDAARFEPDSPEQEEFAPGVDGDGDGGVPEDTTSARYHQHALYALRSREQREKIGLDF